MPVNTILALDLALRTGWAFGSRLGPEQWGAIDVSRETCLGARLSAFELQLGNLLRGFQPSEIWVEKVCGHSGASIMIARCLFGILVLHGFRLRLNIFEVAPNTIKKVVAGTGRAPKNAMRDIAAEAVAVERETLGYDEADAICLLLYAVMQQAEGLTA